jgi:hypothetical protein
MTSAPVGTRARLDVWTLYDSPADMPGFFVLRRFEAHADGTHTETDDVLASVDVEDLRDVMRDRGLSRISRSENDEPHIVESWI